MNKALALQCFLAIIPTSIHTSTTPQNLKTSIMERLRSSGSCSATIFEHVGVSAQSLNLAAHTLKSSPQKFSQHPTLLRGFYSAITYQTYAKCLRNTKDNRREKIRLNSNAPWSLDYCTVCISQQKCLTRMRKQT